MSNVNLDVNLTQYECKFNLMFLDWPDSAVASLWTWLIFEKLKAEIDFLLWKYVYVLELFRRHAVRLYSSQWCDGVVRGNGTDEVGDATSLDVAVALQGTGQMPTCQFESMCMQLNCILLTGLFS